MNQRDVGRLMPAYSQTTGHNCSFTDRQTLDAVSNILTFLADYRIFLENSRCHPNVPVVASCCREIVNVEIKH